RGEQLREALWPRELNGPGAVLADVRDECERVACGDLEAAGPSIEHELVVGQEPPQKRLDRLVAVFGDDQGHRQRERKGFARRAPVVAVAQAQLAAPIALHLS